MDTWMSPIPLTPLESCRNHSSSLGRWEGTPEDLNHFLRKINPAQVYLLIPGRGILLSVPVAGSGLGRRKCTEVFSVLGHRHRLSCPDKDRAARCPHPQPAPGSGNPAQTRPSGPFGLLLPPGVNASSPFTPFLLFPSSFLPRIFFLWGRMDTAPWSSIPSSHTPSWAG